MRRLRTPSGDESWFPDHVAEHLIGNHVPGWIDVTDAYLAYRWGEKYHEQVRRGAPKRPLTITVPPGDNVLPVGQYQPPPHLTPGSRV